MTKETAIQFLPLVQALHDGKTIQYKSADEGWKDVENPAFNMRPDEYRIKPEPRRLWVIEYSDGVVAVYSSKAEAMEQHGTAANQKLSEYVEVQP